MVWGRAGFPITADTGRAFRECLTCCLSSELLVIKQAQNGMVPAKGHTENQTKVKLAPKSLNSKLIVYPLY